MVDDTSGAWSRSGTPLGITTQGELMVSATNRLMATSQLMTPLVTAARARATVLDPRSRAKWRVATTGARWRGRASHAAPSAAVIWTWTMSAPRIAARARAADT